MSNAATTPATQPASAPEKESKRVLEPVERISEILFGLIMVLTYTCSLSVSQAGRSQVDTMLWGAIGCNLAWGIIDAIFYLIASFCERGHNLLLLRRVRETPDAAEAKQIIADAIPPLIAIRLAEDVYDSLHRQVRDLPEPPARPRLTGEDYRGALGVFLLVFASTFPVVIPFTFMSNARLALRTSNVIAIISLYLAGRTLGRYASRRPWIFGVWTVILGAAMVGVCIALGG